MAKPKMNEMKAMLAATAGKATSGRPVPVDAPAPVAAAAAPAAPETLTSKGRSGTRAGKKIVSIYIDESYHDELKIFAIRRKMSMEGMVKHALNEWLAGQGMPPAA
ncbi:hypothetical protein ASG43_21465 [Aureimonas sp. Leaf454]|uniref:ribbon-helix-helix domain-containing protein n=1 Tax=Aureimonas sp. Leaf454 TaxID=1736381 RepID=UPI000700DF2F|nr:CopG family transcriptional regulator [Aureimonas sp. Leaf454]KQT51176.1 hypothetical protein ASG43_21465 [Aureimonas sp. Leaf454]